jgi:hypothetical protein
MTRNVIATVLGEGDYLPHGPFAINLPFSGLATHLGTIPFPAGESQGVLFAVITTVGGFRIAGNCQSSARPIVEWTQATGWQDTIYAPMGNKPCIYDNYGRLVVNDGSAGSQGYRYVTPDNRLMTGDETVGPLYHVSKWTDLSLLQDRTMVIGQAHWTNAVVMWDGEQHRLIESVAGSWITAHRSGELCSITYATDTYAVLLLATEAELRTFPVIEGPEVEPPPSTEPPPVTEPEPPEPEPEPEPEPQPPEEPLVQKIYAKYGEYYTGCSPDPVKKSGKAKSGDTAYPVYWNREGMPNTGGAWEELELTEHEEGLFDARYISADRQLSMDDDGNLQTREAGVFGAWEQFYATTQPDGVSVLYRKDGTGNVVPNTVLTVEPAA